MRYKYQLLNYTRTYRIPLFNSTRFCSHFTQEVPVWVQECKVLTQTQFPWDVSHISKSQYLVPSLISNGVYPKAILSNRDWSIYLEVYLLQSEVSLNQCM